MNINAITNVKNRLTRKDKEAIARLLSTTPEAMDEFERAYRAQAIDTDTGSIFDMPAKAYKSMTGRDAATDADKRIALILAHDIAGDLVALTCGNALPEGTDRRIEMNAIPREVRPQLTATAMWRHMGDTPSWPALLEMYAKHLENPKEMLGYHMFRQGLDMLDLDEVLYAMLSRNPNSMGHWVRQLEEAAAEEGFFKCPKTIVAKVPMPILQLSRMDYEALTPATLAVVNEWAREVFGIEEGKDYFVKTGTFSSKFDARNAIVRGEEVGDIGEYLLYISHLAVMMAGPLSGHPTYGVSTTNEWVVREYIEDVENNPTIYKGLPLHTEYRFFIDCDYDAVLGVSPYWRPDVMKKRFGEASDSDTVHNFHDYVTYCAHEETLMRRYNDNVDMLEEHVAELVKGLDLEGQWSLDVMQNGDDFWLIDMATADTSALADCVDRKLLRKTSEDWVPRLAEVYGE